MNTECQTLQDTVQDLQHLLLHLRQIQTQIYCYTLMAQMVTPQPQMMDQELYQNGAMVDGHKQVAYSTMDYN